MVLNFVECKNKGKEIDYVLIDPWHILKDVSVPLSTQKTIIAFCEREHLLLNKRTECLESKQKAYGD